jgi:hypothetical protein
MRSSKRNMTRFVLLLLCVAAILMISTDNSLRLSSLTGGGRASVEKRDDSVAKWNEWMGRLTLTFEAMNASISDEELLQHGEDRSVFRRGCGLLVPDVTLALQGSLSSLSAGGVGRFDLGIVLAAADRQDGDPARATHRFSRPFDFEGDNVPAPGRQLAASAARRELARGVPAGAAERRRGGIPGILRGEWGRPDAWVAVLSGGPRRADYDKLHSDTNRRDRRVAACQPRCQRHGGGD